VSGEVEFVLIPLADLRPHEAVVEHKVRRLAIELRRTGVFVEPVWVAQGSNVILNGHHRVAALRRLGGDRVPALRIDYASDIVRLDRWRPGPPITKDEVIRRAEEGRLFPPRTTRHIWRLEPGERPVPLVELGIPRSTSPAHARRTGRARSAPGRSSPPG
jgi:L-serine kinase (ADP)